MSLNDLICRNAKPQAKSYRLADSEGLFLLVLPNGTRTWRIKYYIHGKERVIALGRYPTVSLAQAREEREKIKKDIHNGIDPVLARDEAKRLAKYKANQTLELVVREWHTNNLDTWCDSHGAAILSRFEYHIFPDIWPYSNIIPHPKHYFGVPAKS